MSFDEPDHAQQPHGESWRVVLPEGSGARYLAASRGTGENPLTGPAACFCRIVGGSQERLAENLAFNANLWMGPYAAACAGNPQTADHGPALKAVTQRSAPNKPHFVFAL